MAPVEISEVVSTSERNAFIKFPWQTYRHDPAWVPPLILERKEFLDRKKHPFYKNAEAMQTFVGEEAKVMRSLFGPQ